MADYWAKVFIEILDDPKMGTMPDRLWRRTIELFLLAKELNKDGHLPSTKQIAWRLRMPTDDLDLDMKQIALTKIIVQEADGWFIVHFEERQAASTDAERKRQQRDRDRKEQYYGHNNVTDASRNVRQSREQINRLTETEQSRSEVIVGAPSDPFQIMQSTCEQMIGRLATPGDIETLKKFVDQEVTAGDISAAIDWYKTEKGKVVTSISMLDGPVFFAKAKRIQGANKSNGRHPAETPEKDVDIRYLELNPKAKDRDQVIARLKARGVDYADNQK